MRNNIFILLVVALTSCGREEYKLPFYATADFTPQWFRKGDEKLNTVHRIAPFSFTDQNHNIITNNNTKGKICVADFFFTRCAGICPKMTTNMKKIADSFSGDTTVMFLSHSVTPEYDSIAVLKKYEKEKNITNANWHLLTGDKYALYKLARTSYFAEMKDGYSKNTNEFLHTENFILTDKEGRIRGIYNGTLETHMNDLIDHIKLLQKED